METIGNASRKRNPVERVHALPWSEMALSQVIHNVLLHNILIYCRIKRIVYYK